jgi:hypothetical protein
MHERAVVYESDVIACILLVSLVLLTVHVRASRIARLTTASPGMWQPVLILNQDRHGYELELRY